MADAGSVAAGAAAISSVCDDEADALADSVGSEDCAVTGVPEVSLVVSEGVLVEGWESVALLTVALLEAEVAL